VNRLVAVIDTCVLVNFLAIDRVDLLAPHAVYRFVITGHVRREVLDSHAEQLGRLDKALSAGAFDTAEVSADNEVFVNLAQGRRLGAGEAASIAHAVTRGLPLVIDDRQARKAATTVAPQIVLESTQSLMVAAVRAGSLELSAADAIKAEWETKHRFKLPFANFGDLIQKTA
jgi:predicted nucleic acid-binding protein